MRVPVAVPSFAVLLSAFYRAVLDRKIPRLKIPSPASPGAVDAGRRRFRFQTRSGCTVPKRLQGASAASAA